MENTEMIRLKIPPRRGQRRFSAFMMTAAAVMLMSCVFPAGEVPTGDVSNDDLQDITLPEGFAIEIWAPGLEGARSMALSDEGVLFVGTRGAGNVYAVIPDGDGARRTVTIAQGLNSPNGVALRDGDLYVAEIHRVIVFENIHAHLTADAPYRVIDDSFPTDAHHGWKFIAFGPDGKLYIPVGVPCNICESEDDRFGTIMRMNPDGSELEIFASGIRNTVGFDWDPETQVLWFTDNGRDWLGDDLPPDELNIAPESGMHFGFPWCYGKNHPDPEYEGQDCSKYTGAALELGPHVAALGMRFYTGSMFPEDYRGDIFIAEHGSWNRSVPIGYRIMHVNVRDNRPVSYEVFAEGWLQGGAAWGRPVDVLVMPDGSLLVSDDKGGAVYRIYYED